MSQTPSRSPITTHVLNVSQGRAAAGIPVTLDRLREPDQWQTVAHGITNADGRIEDLLPRGSRAEAATYRLTFDTATYFRTLGLEGFYPAIQITFAVGNPEEHYHVPLLLSPYGYSTYRGT